MNRLWNIRPPTPELARNIAQQFSLSEVIAQLLVHRGLESPASISAFLDPRLKDLSDPFLLPDMAKAVSRILSAIESKEKIIVFGDYDVDGMTSVALLLDVFAALGGQCGYFIPSRFTDGYGLTKDSLQRCIEEGAKLIVSADCGTNSADEILYARSHGVDVIVLDHHEHNGMPFQAVAVVNPKRSDSLYKEELSSVGIAFKLAHALVKALRENRGNQGHVPNSILNSVRVPDFPAGVPDFHFDLKDVLDLVAIGTIGDMVPLLGENRILVKAGLARLAQTSRPGLRVLRDLAGVRDSVSASDVAFRIAPRLNANGRLADAQDSLALLRTRSESEAMMLAQRLHQQNQRRQQMEKQIVEEAIALVASRKDYEKEPVLVLFHPAWHVGVVGIIATKLLKHFGKPAIVIGQDNGVGKGSARSIAGFDIADALHQAKADLITCGGHRVAAGLTIEPSRVDSFRKAINRVAAQILDGSQPHHGLDLDMEIQKDQLNPDLIEQLNRLEPFGMGNARPVFATRRICVENDPYVVGAQHLKFQTRIKETLFDVIGFSMAKNNGFQNAIPKAGEKIDIAYHPCVNIFGGQRRLQLNLEDFRSSH